MPTPGQPILDPSGRPCLATTGRPIVADAGGSASCACGVCPSYLRADYCSPGDCSLVTYVYFCSTWIAGCCNANGCPGSPARPVQVGDVVEYEGRCFRVNSLATYAIEDIPAGSIILTGSVAEGSRVCMGPPWFACSDCPEINGYINCNLICACGGSQGGGGLPPGGIYISCADMRWFFLHCQFCPIFRVDWPIGSGKWFCVKPNFDIPTQPSLPPGAVEIGAQCGYLTCCDCCSDSVGPGQPQPTCCSCGALGPSPCVSTTYTYGQPTVVTPYGCCWKNAGWAAHGSGLRSDYYAGFPTYPFRTIELSVFGQVATYTEKTYDYSGSGGVLTTNSYDLPVTSSPCGFFPGAEPMTNSFGGGDPGTSRGRMTTQCDLIKWDYVNDNWPTGGVKVVSRGTISIVPTVVEPCNANPCQSFGLGESGSGCSDCFTLALGVSVEDMEGLVP